MSAFATRQAILHSSPPHLLRQEISQLIEADLYHQDQHLPGKSELEELLRKGKAYDRLKDKIAKFVNETTLGLQTLAELEEDDEIHADEVEKEVVMEPTEEEDLKDPSAPHGQLELEDAEEVLRGQEGVGGLKQLSGTAEEPKELLEEIAVPIGVDTLPITSPSFVLPATRASPIASTSAAVPAEDSLDVVQTLPNLSLAETGRKGTPPVASSASGGTFQRSSSPLSVPIGLCEVGGQIVVEKDLKLVIDHEIIFLRDKAAKIASCEFNKKMIVEAKIPDYEHPPIALEFSFRVDGRAVLLRVTLDHSRESWETATAFEICNRLLAWSGTSFEKKRNFAMLRLSYFSQVILFLSLESALPEEEKSFLKLQIECFGPEVPANSIQDQKSVLGSAVSLEWNGDRTWWMVWNLKPCQDAPALCVISEGESEDTSLFWLNLEEIAGVTLPPIEARPFVCSVALSDVNSFDDARFRDHFDDNFDCLHFVFLPKNIKMEMDTVDEKLQKNLGLSVSRMELGIQRRLLNTFKMAGEVRSRVRRRSMSLESRDRSASPGLEERAASLDFDRTSTSPAPLQAQEDSPHHSLPYSLRHFSVERSVSPPPLPRAPGSNHTNVWDRHGLRPVENSSTSSSPRPSSPFQQIERSILLSPVVSPTSFSPILPPETWLSTPQPTSLMDVGTSFPASPSPRIEYHPKSLSRQQTGLSDSGSPEADGEEEEEVENQLLPQREELRQHKRRRSQSVHGQGGEGKRPRGLKSIDGSPSHESTPPQNDSAMNLDSGLEDDDRSRVKRESQSPSLDDYEQIKGAYSSDVDPTNRSSSPKTPPRLDQPTSPSPRRTTTPERSLSATINPPRRDGMPVSFYRSNPDREMPPHPSNTSERTTSDRQPSLPPQSLSARLQKSPPRHPSSGPSTLSHCSILPSSTPVAPKAMREAWARDSSLEPSEMAPSEPRAMRNSVGPDGRRSNKLCWHGTRCYLWREGRCPYRHE